jgi:hypothetical protein
MWLGSSEGFWPADSCPREATARWLLLLLLAGAERRVTLPRGLRGELSRWSSGGGDYHARRRMGRPRRCRFSSTHIADGSPASMLLLAGASAEDSAGSRGQLRVWVTTMGPGKYENVDKI